MTLPSYVAIDNGAVGYADLTACIVAVQAWITANSPAQIIDVQFMYADSISKVAAVIIFT